MKMKFRSRFRTMALLVVGLAIGSSSFIGANSAQAYVNLMNQFPSKYDTYQTDYPPPPPPSPTNVGVYYDQKLSNPGEANISEDYANRLVKRNQFAVYFDSKPAANFYIRYYVGGCTVNKNAQVTITIGADTSTPKDYILLGNEQICGDNTHAPTSPADPFGLKDPLVRRYPVGNLARYDPSIDKWKLRVDVTLKVASALDSIKFTIATNNTSAKVGNVASEKTNNAIFNKRYDRNYFGTSNFGFGVGCSATAGGRYPVTIYDADNNIPGQSGNPVRFSVYKGNNVELTKDEYYNVRGAKVKQRPNGTAYVQPDGGQGNTSSVEIDMLPGVPYSLQVWNVFHAGGKSDKGPASNFFSIGVPGEGIFGDKDLDCAPLPPPPPVPAGGKSPKIQVLGGDVRVRGKIATSLTPEPLPPVISTKVFGSWVEFGAFSTGSNDAFGSGAGLRGNSSVARVDWSKLTFANTNKPAAGDLYGGFSLPLTPQIASYFDAKAGDNCVNPLVGGVHACADGVILDGRTDINDTVIIKSSGTVTINGNIIYRDGSYANITQLPQVVIIADKIVINDSVDRVDAWLITRAGGWIKTCGDKDPNAPLLSKVICSKLLTVNGPVLTDKLYLHRTAGSDDAVGATDAQKSAPGEIFNLRPDTYLWGYSQGLLSTHPRSAAITELPPRF